MNERLSEQQLSNILPLLSGIANDLAKGIVPDPQRLVKRSLLTPEARVDDLALQELKLWIDILRQVKARGSSDAVAIQFLQDRGIPEAPAILAVNLVSGSLISMESPPRGVERKLGPVDILISAEPYHAWLPDHDWHNDLDWEHLPSFIKDTHILRNMLLQGKEINSRNVSYKITNGRLIRKLHDERPTVLLQAPGEQYHEWLSDHRWHDDLDYGTLPLWIKRNQQILNTLLIHGEKVTGKYVSYKVFGNRLMRKLHDSVPVHGQIEEPRESYHRRLRDNRWHNDLDWGHLPLWIKGNPKVVDELRRGRQIEGRTISYKMVQNRLMRRLKR
jgi:hypothetical protein